MNDGGQAFPRTGGFADSKGMSLRDYMAVKAMQTFMHDLNGQADRRYLKDNGIVYEDLVSKGSYQMADAMLKAREANNA